MQRRWVSYQWYALAVLPALTSWSCVKNPVTGGTELALLSPAQERRIGAEMAAQVEMTVGLAESPELSAYVKDLGSRIAAHSPRQGMNYQFDLLDLPDPNAFALPDGHVYVTRGILGLSNSEDELASLLGHEVGHVAARHAAQRYSAAAPVGILTGVTSALVGVVSSDARDAVAGFGGGLNETLLAPYGRSQEHQADRVGQDLSFAAGWNPAAMTSLLTSLDRMEVFLADGAPRGGSWLDSHPKTQQRISETRAYAEQLGAGRVITEQRRESFIRRLDGLLVGENAAHGVFLDNLFVHPALKFVLQFPRGWATANNRMMAGAQSPREDVLMAVMRLGEGDDPMLAARQFAGIAKLEYASGPVARKVGACDAAEATVFDEERYVTLIFVAHAGTLLQIIVVTTPQKRDQYEPVVQRTLQSFQRPTEYELGRISELRLDVVRPLAEETLEELLVRHHTASPLAAVAILNGLEASPQRLTRRWVKVPVKVPFGRQGG